MFLEAGTLLDIPIGDELWIIEKLDRFRSQSALLFSPLLTDQERMFETGHLMLDIAARAFDLCTSKDHSLHTNMSRRVWPSKTRIPAISSSSSSSAAG